MPAGDLISLGASPVFGEVEIRGTLTGGNTVYGLEKGGITGLGVPPAKTHDVDLAHAAGAYLGRDYAGIRIITVPYALDGGLSATPSATAGAAFVALSALWAASTTDIPLHLRVAGFGHISVSGRPRGLVDDLSDLHELGFVRALATFVCGDPTITVVSA